jgi:hypothetical protein
LTRPLRLLAPLLASAVIALAAVTAARADGDPASDILYNGRVFFPFTSSTSSAARDALVETIRRSEKAGYPIRVALIEKPEDLGALTSLWGKPRQYARFLDIELTYFYKGPLLIIMPAGLGFAHYKHKTAAEYQRLAGLQVAEGRDGLALTAINAVSALARQAGQPIAPAALLPDSGGTATGTRVLVGVPIILVLLGGIAAGVILTRKRRRAT